MQLGLVLEKFVQTLLPNFHGETVESSLKAVKTECIDKTLPPYRSVIEANIFRGEDAFKHVWSRSANNLIMVGLPKGQRLFKDQPNFVYVVAAVLAEMPKRIDTLIKFSDINTGRVVSSTGITYPQATIVRMSELLEFFQVYARRLLLHVYAKEHETLVDKTDLISEPLAPKEVKWLEQRLGDFTLLLNVFGSNEEDFVRKLKSIPDITVEQEESVQQAVKANAGAKLDPFTLNIIPYTWNPIYHARVMVAEWRKSRLDAATTERELLEMRLEALRAKKEAGQSNAKMEKNIQGMQDRLRKLNMKIADLESSFKETN